MDTSGPVHNKNFTEFNDWKCNFLVTLKKNEDTCNPIL